MDRGALDTTPGGTQVPPVLPASPGTAGDLAETPVADAGGGATAGEPSRPPAPQPVDASTPGIPSLPP
ncbi:MAG TPA: hypothetical protein VM430_10280, partial [Microbacterium sp.]|nr:hypothetical protein [Microbacterium sp.]